jgi:hypothetical protein
MAIDQGYVVELTVANAATTVAELTIAARRENRGGQSAPISTSEKARVAQLDQAAISDLTNVRQTRNWRSFTADGGRNPIESGASPRID